MATDDPAHDLTDELAQLLRDFLAAHETMPGVLLHVDAPAIGLSWSGGAGVSEVGGAASGTTLDGTECFRTASVTKSFVAVAVLRLLGSIGATTDDPALDHLPARAAEVLRALTPAAPDVTLRHLLQHTAGIHDFGTDAHYRKAIAVDPLRVWDAYDLLAVAVDHGTPCGTPGERFHYADTGYVLLALVLEHHTGRPFAPTLRDLACIDRLGLTATWLEGKEPAPATAPTRVHQYLGDADTFGFDPSFDGYGGGGLVSTGRDLARFVRAVLHDDDLLAPAQRAAMLDCSAVTDLGDVGQRCGLGIFESTIDGIRRVGHEGFWGVWMYHFPDHDVTMGGTHTMLPFDPAAQRRLLHGALAVVSG